MLDGMSLNPAAAPVHLQSPSQAKIARFRSLFRGREDVYARRFESRKTGKSGYAPAGRRRASAGTASSSTTVLAQDVRKELDAVLDTILRSLAAKREHRPGTRKPLPLTALNVHAGMA